MVIIAAAAPVIAPYGESEIVAYEYEPWSTTYLLGRLTSVVYSIGILLAIYWIGRRAFSERVGLLATAILAISAADLAEPFGFTAENVAGRMRSVLADD